MSDDDRSAPSVPPSRATLTSLDSDQWAAVLPHLRAALRTIEAAAGEEIVSRLVSSPISRLAGGRGRRELMRLLSSEPALWEAVRQRVLALEPVPPPLSWVLEGDDDTSDPAPSRAEGRQRDRERLRGAREERDAWRRRAEGAQARAERAEAEAASLHDEVSGLVDRVDELQVELRRADEDRARAVERERRRRETELAELRGQLADLRRAEDERRRERRRRREAREQQRRLEESAAGGAPSARGAPLQRVVPGRPSSLPDGVVAGTTEAADLLLQRGRRVLVDGYNLTLQHRSQLDIERQRNWLVQTLSNAAARRGIRPVVVFDGERPGGFRAPGRVEVRFTAAGVTADDELVLDVEATDEPVVVVTDDRELRQRVAASGADVVGTRSFLGVVT